MSIIEVLCSCMGEDMSTDHHPPSSKASLLRLHGQVAIYDLLFPQGFPIVRKARGSHFLPHLRRQATKLFENVWVAIHNLAFTAVVLALCVFEVVGKSKPTQFS